jgi:hypothetical protein
MVRPPSPINHWRGDSTRQAGRIHPPRQPSCRHGWRSQRCAIALSGLSAVCRNSLYARSLRRRRYDYYGYPYRSRPVGGSCLRDACLLDAGCCLGESLSGNCFVVALLALPQLTVALIDEARTLRHKPAAAGSQLTSLLVAGVRTYQREISPRRPQCCHFTPTCSEYAAQALQTHGARRGSWLTIKRLGRCRPSRPTANDPVPGSRFSV